ncbi:hypothetical protein AD998_18230 [bacterium 336/3]|nr:hypothetical protein AD998_18230 [bacterium 336/3]
MGIKSKTPKVNQVNEFKEIANNFANPLEIVREAISNSIDARSNLICLHFDIVDHFGEELFRVIIKDNGKGMNEDELESFFDLGNSTKIGDKDVIGEKGHGTKVYFHSRQVNLTTYKNGKCIKAKMKDIYKSLNQNIIPTYEYEITDSELDKSGTEIEIIGYNLNKYSAFKHAILKDYILWKTKFGAIDKVFDITTFNDYKISLKGLDVDTPEQIEFGHIFPQESDTANKLFEIHNNNAPDYFCKKWIEVGILPNFPHIKYQSVFYVEGKNIKYSYNPMLRRQGYKAPDDSYTIQDRYGLWLTKDFIPIQRKNEWIVSKGSEYTKFHAFFNCQNFKLTANRGSVEATTPEILQDIEKKVREIYDSIINSDEYAILDWLQGEAKGYDTVKKEKREYERRKKYALKQKVAEFKGVKLYEPQLESGVHALLMQLSILEPDLFPFEMIDYNTNTGIDILVKEKNNLSIDQSRIYYVELKNFLDKTFNHSFEYLHSIVCWDTKILDGDEIVDIQEKKRVLHIVNPESTTDHTRYFLDDPRDERRIVVYVLKDFLKEKLNIDFRPRQTK